MRKRNLLDAGFDTIALREQKFVLVGNLTEAKLDSDKRTAEVVVIQKGWSKNGFYYGENALEDIKNHLNTTAERVYLNHNKRSEIFEPRKEEDHVANNVVAALSEDKTQVIAKAKFFESGPNNWVFQRMQETGHTFGPSIVGKAKIRNGEVDGRKGPIVENIPYLHSYDMVSSPAAGGKVNSVTEAEGVWPTEHSNEFVHVFEGIVSDEDEAFLLEALGRSEENEDDEDDEDSEEALHHHSPAKRKDILKAKMKQKRKRREALDTYYDLEYTFTSEISAAVLAREDYEFVNVADRKSLIEPIIDEFAKEIAKIDFVEPRPMPSPSITAEQIDEAEISEADGQVKIVLHKSGVFEKNTFRKVVISKENGITMTVGKLKKSKLKSVVRSYEFDTKMGWTPDLAKSWLSKNIKSNISKEGVEPMFKTLAELKSENPALYEAVITEAKTDAQAADKVSGWKKDSDELSSVKESAKTVEEERDTLKTDKKAADAENKTLKEANDKFLAEKIESRKTEIISEVKKEVGLEEAFCSDSFNSVLESIEFDSEKEDEFKVAIKEQVEDRKSIIGGEKPVVNKKKIDGAGRVITKESENSDSKISSNKSFAESLKRG